MSTDNPPDNGVGPWTEDIFITQDSLMVSRIIMAWKTFLLILRHLQYSRATSRVGTDDFGCSG